MSQFQMMLSEDGSGKGAALVAAVSDSTKLFSDMAIIIGKAPFVLDRTSALLALGHTLDLPPMAGDAVARAASQTIEEEPPA